GTADTRHLAGTRLALLLYYYLRIDIRISDFSNSGDTTAVVQSAALLLFHHGNAAAATRGLLHQVVPGIFRQPELAGRGQEQFYHRNILDHYFHLPRHPGGAGPEPLRFSVQNDGNGTTDLADDCAADHFRGGHVFLLLENRLTGHPYRRHFGACRVGDAIRGDHGYRDPDRLRSQPDPRGRQPGIFADAYLLPYHGAVDNPRGNIRRLVCIYYLVRRSRGRAVCRQLQTTHDSLANVFRHQGRNQSDHHGGSHHTDCGFGRLAGFPGTAAPPHRTLTRNYPSL
ncbi:MAG: Polyamine ABC transporter, permease protein, partial [Olavius algarvensis Gamma 3 endosymbiont]